MSSVSALPHPLPLERSFIQENDVIVSEPSSDSNDAVDRTSDVESSDMDLSSSDFRKRRLSLSCSKGPTTSSPLAVHRASTLYRSQEINSEIESTLPFPDSILGSFSCHGIEPSYSYDDSVVAKINQDRGCVIYPFANDRKQALFSVFDGHGENGDLISHFVMDGIRETLESHPLLYSDTETALRETYLKVDRSLSDCHGMEAFFSGTTAVTVLIQNDTIWTANVGDSRAVIAKKLIKGRFLAKNISNDQNPNSPPEQERIEKAGGFVSPPPEPGLSSRVWLDEGMTQVGLAMARSIGDHAVKSIGVVADPEVLSFGIDEEDDVFIIIASDGVWEFITSQEAVDIVAKRIKFGCKNATKALIDTASQRWKAVEGDYRDDITALVIKIPCFPEDH